MSASLNCAVDLSLHPKQTQAITTEATEVLFGGAAGPGKALALDTPIPTPTGWTTQGDLRVGDKVFDENGKPCLVTATTEVMIDRPCYKVVFDDGSCIVADEAHEWLTFTNSEREALRRLCPEFREKRRKKRPKKGTGKKPWLSEMNSSRDYVYLPKPTGTIKTTLEIKETLTIYGRSNHFISVCSGLQTEKCNLPIDPYVLGAWLGDGTSCDGSITTADSEIIDRIKSAGFEAYKWQSGKYRWNVKGLRSKLVKAGLRNNKHIPDAYLRASFKQRMELLRGLMDTDGTISKDGECDFTNCNLSLARGVLELLVSVGIKAALKTGRARLKGVDCGEKYRIAFSTSKTVFALSRKKDRLREKERGVQGWRVVKSVEPVESVPVKCITVDSESHLYLAGKGMIPTHNSHAMRAASIIWASEIPGLQVYLFRRLYDDLVKNHLEGPSGYHNLLAGWVQSKFVRIVDDEIRFWNGSKIYLCHVQHEKNRFKYQGAEIHVLLIDELTHFTEKIYRFLRGRVRMIGLDDVIPEKYKGKFPRILAGSNPGNIGHQWVKASFIDGGEDGRIRQMSEDEGGMLRQFIKARLDDNPSLLKDDPKYVSKLSGLGNPALVKAMKEGDWNIIEGAFFTEWSEERHVLRPVPLPDHWLRFRAGDWGSAKPYSFHWFAVASEDWQHPDGAIIPRGAMVAYKELYGVKTSPDGSFQPDVGVKEPSTVVAKHIKERDGDDEIAYGVLDPAAFAVTSGPSIAEEMAKEGVLFRRADNKRVANGGAIGGHDQFRKRLVGDDDGRPMIFFFENCKHAIRTIPVLQHDANRPEDVDTHMEDHCFASGTLVDTAHGQIPIEKLASEGMVYSIGGLKKYRSARRIAKDKKLLSLLFEDGTTVTCTPDHRFMTTKGWVEAKDMEGKLCSQLSSLKQYKNLRVLDTTYAESTFSAKVLDFIAKFGKSSMETYLKAFTSIILMRTPQTTPMTTWNCSNQKSICQEDIRKCSQELGKTRFNTHLKELRSGTVPMKVRNGTRHITPKTLLNYIKNTIANVVIAGSRLKERTKASFAAIHASLHQEGSLVQTMKNAFAYSVEAFLKQIDTPPSEHALKLALRLSQQTSGVECLSVKEAGTGDVYCITVPKTGMFAIEGGFLVSNCYDGCRYGVMSRPWTTDSLLSDEDRERATRYKAIEERLKAAREARNERR